MTTPDAVPFPVVVSAGADQLRLAMAAYLSRYMGRPGSTPSQIYAPT